jgi:hypothetical protein
MNIRLNKTKLSQAAKTLKSQFASKNVTRNGQPIGLQFCYEMVCQSLLSKPYGEVKNLIDKSANPTKTQPRNSYLTSISVYLFHYNLDTVLAHTDNTGELVYVNCTEVGTDLEISQKQIQEQAKRLAEIFKTEVISYDIPPVLDAVWEADDLFKAIKEMGFIGNKFSLLNILEQNPEHIFINEHHYGYGLNGDWKDVISDDEISFEEAMEAVIWIVEIKINNQPIELYVTLKELLQAHPLDEFGQEWMVKSCDSKFRVSLSK